MYVYNHWLFTSLATTPSLPPSFPPQVELYLRQNVCAHEGRLVLETTGLVDGVRHEVHLFSTLSLARMMKTPGDHGSVGWVMSCTQIYQTLSFIYTEFFSTYSCMVDSMSKPSTKRPDDLLRDYDCPHDVSRFK